METFGKCNFISLENGLKCGCLRYRNNQIDGLLCEGCKHDQTFHEYNNQAVSPKNTHYLSVNSELNNIFKKRKVPNAYQSEVPSISIQPDEFNINPLTTKSQFNPYQIPRPMNNKHKNQKPTIVFSIIILPDGTLTPKIPRNVANLNKNGYIRAVSFPDNSNDGIKKTIEDLWPFLRSRDWKFFRCTSTSELGVADTPNVGWNVEALKSIAGARKKLYIGPIDGSIQMSSTTPSSTTASPTTLMSTSAPTSSSPSLQITSQTPSISSPSSSLPLSTFLDVSSPDIGELWDDDNLANYFLLEKNSKNVRKFLHKFLKENQKILDTKVITLHLPYDDPTKELYFWAKYATTEDLLKDPSISYLEESVIDIGGAFRDLTQRFWDFVRQKYLENAIQSGIIFDQINNQRYLISYNPTAIHTKVFFTVGKLLFWTLIHDGFWPHWLDPIQFQFIFDENTIINSNIKSVCTEINPTVGRVINNLDNIADYTIDKAYSDEPYFKEFLMNNDIQIYTLKNISSISEFLADLVVFGKKKEMIQELKNGFNQCDIINKIKSSSFEWQEFEQILYKIATSNKDLFDQFDANIPKEDTIEHHFYMLLMDYLTSLKEVEDIHNVLKFITGGIQIPVVPKIKVKYIDLRDSADIFIHKETRLPKAFTCFNQLNLCVNYDLTSESKQFVSDLNNAFSQCHVGFNEDALREDYPKFFDKPKEDDEQCMYSNSLIILLGFIFLAIFLYCLLF